MPESSIPDIVAARRQPGDGSAPWSSPLAALPWDIENILKCAAGDSAALAAAAKACGTRPVVAESACRWFIRHVLFRPGASYYWNLGVERNASIDLIRAHYRHLISIFHPDRLQQSDEREWYESFAKRVNEAYNTLKNGDARLKYDRLQNVEVAQAGMRRAGTGHATTESGRGGDSLGKPPGRTSRPIFARASWRNAPSRGAVPEWIEKRRPTTLKVLAFGGIVAIAVGAVALTRAHKSPAADVALPSDSTPQTAPRETDVHLSDLLKKPNSISQSPALTAPVVVTTNPREASAVSADIRALSANHRSIVGDAGKIAISATMAPPVHDAAKVNDASAAATVPEPQALAALDSGAFAEAPTQIAAATMTSTPIQRATGPVPMQVAALTAVTPPPSITAVDIDQLIARFARSYDDGDIGALMRLIDPEQARDDRMAFTMANFSRVFRETTSRKLDLREVTRSINADHARVQLETQTVTFGDATGRRSDSGQMTLMLRKRGDEALITEMLYRAKVGG